MRLQPKKGLGQNFLSDKNIQSKIIAACNFQKGDTVLEIGPGTGIFTGLIAPKVKALYAVELDASLSKELEQAFAGAPNVKIINQDILKFNLGSYLRGSKQKIKVFGNIPYYISTPIIERLFCFRKMIECVFLTVQKEFALRICAFPGSKDYGSLSCFIQYYSEPEKLFTIKRTSFFPQPKVDSAFLRLKLKPKLLLGPREEKRFFLIIRSAFGKRRKALRNSLEGVASPQQLTGFFSACHIDPNIRPEQLSLQEFINLSRI